MAGSTISIERVAPERDTPAPGRRALRWPLTLLVVLTVLAVLLVAAGCWLGLRSRDQSRTAQDGRAAQAAARDVAGQLTTISSSSSDRNVAALLAGSTGSLKEQIAQSATSLQQVLAAGGVSSKGSVVGTGLSSLSGRQAVVLVAVDARLTSPKGQSVTRQYRMTAKVSRVGKRWLVSDLEFAA
jgi:Mce-associated membrane protein